jgi:DNA-binding NtrC family response regulator
LSNTNKSKKLPEAIMNSNIFALLVHSQPEPFQELRRTLHSLSVETYSVPSCREAGGLISQCQPHIVFSERWLPDGSWLTISDLAEDADIPLSVIVVAAVPDVRLYLSVMERGAFDFVAPPFENEAIDFVVRSAALNTRRRRGALAPATAR